MVLRPIDLGGKPYYAVDGVIQHVSPDCPHGRTSLKFSSVELASHAIEKGIILWIPCHGIDLSAIQRCQRPLQMPREVLTTHSPMERNAISNITRSAPPLARHSEFPQSLENCVRDPPKSMALPCAYACTNLSAVVLPRWSISVERRSIVNANEKGHFSQPGGQGATHRLVSPLLYLPSFLYNSYLEPVCHVSCDKLFPKAYMIHTNR